MYLSLSRISSGVQASRGPCWTGAVVGLLLAGVELDVDDVDGMFVDEEDMLRCLLRLD